MNKTLTILCLLMLPAFFSMAAATKKDPDVEKGDYFFQHEAYSDALGHYEKVALKNPRKKDAVLHAHIADCYRLMKNPEQAAYWYARASVAPRGYTKDVRLHYAGVLMTLQRYDTAVILLKSVLATAPNDPAATTLMKGCDLAVKLKTQPLEGPAELLTINTDGSDFAPVLQGGDMVFTSDYPILGAVGKEKWTGRSFYNIYKVSCNKQGVCGSNYSVVSDKLNSKYHDGSCSFTAGGKEMYFTRTNIKESAVGTSGIGDEKDLVHLEIMVATDYDAQQKKYTKLTRFPYDNKEYSSVHPAISADGKTLIFASDMPGGVGGTDLYICNKKEDGTWSKPANMGTTINTKGEELFPAILPDNIITFASTGHPGLGGLDVFYAKGDLLENSWQAPENAGMPVNSPYDDMSLVMNEDGINGFFSSDRPAEKKKDNIYHYLRQQVFFRFTIKDPANGKPMAGAKVVFQTGADSTEYTADENGVVAGNLATKVGYDVTVSMKDYEDTKLKVSTSNLIHTKDTLVQDIHIMPNTSVVYNAPILDEATREPIENPLLVISREGSGKTDTIQLQTGEALNTMLQTGAVYHINALKTDYYSDEKVVKTSFKITLHNLSDTILMCKLTVGAICQIESIFYDYDKATIRADAVPSMNKLLKLLQDHPSMQVQLNSHTDCRGEEAYNKKLSERRAQSVIDFISKKGIKANRLKARGFGEENPVYKCEKCEDCPESEQQQNRRTEFQVLHM